MVSDNWHHVPGLGYRRAVLRTRRDNWLQKVTKCYRTEASSGISLILAAMPVTAHPVALDWETGVRLHRILQGRSRRLETPMANMRRLVLKFAPGLLALALTPLPILAIPVQDAQATAAKPTSFLGTVQSIDAKQLSVKNDAGATMQVTVQDDARVLRVEPGQKSLQGASPLDLKDLQVGDRVLVRGSTSPDGKQLNASMLVAIKKADIAQKQAQEKEEWQKRGVGGLVKAVDPAAGTITLSTNAGKQTLTVQTSSSTVIRRYAPGSIQFDDAKPAPLSDTKPGDQLRARGVKSADGQSFQAEEIVSGSFRNIAGTITAINPSVSTLTVMDLVTKQPVVVQIASSTEIKKLDPAMAQRIATRLRGDTTGAGVHPAPSGSAGSPPAGAGPSGPGGAGGPGGGPPHGQMGPGQSAPDPQQFLARAPDATLKDFQKGNAVMLVATEGASPGSVSAVTLVGGVEPMLQASASGSQAMMSSWNLGGGGGDAGGGSGTP